MHLSDDFTSIAIKTAARLGRHTTLCLVTALFVAATALPSARAANSSSVVLDAMSSELQRAFTSLGKQEQGKQLPPYFLSYLVRDSEIQMITAQFGALTGSAGGHMRMADVQIRLGSPALDNAHGDHRASAVTSIQMPVTDDRAALERTLWQATNTGYGAALDNYLRVKTEAQVRAKEEDSSPDLSQEKPQVHLEKPAPTLVFDKTEWENRAVALSRAFREYPHVYENAIILYAQNTTETFVSSEGSRIVTPHLSVSLAILATTRANDGMDLFLAKTFSAETAAGLPSQAEMEKAVRALGAQLEALRTAPVTEPFNGPALLSGRAAAVFFHEVLGHRLEGQRQRGDDEGQTFTKEVGKEILPSFLSVADDPTLSTIAQTVLDGHYLYDEEGQPAQRAELIKDGVLKSFLMSRLPIANFASSNGHGRAQSGRVPTGRQGNLLVTSTKTLPEAELRKQLVAEAKRQGKPYGLYFEDISSGFAVTQRSSPQAFQVIPLVVWRVYVDGRPDELVRGVSIVGTPLAAMKKILVTGDKPAIFNGVCGAESGSVPVSAISPAILMSEMETQRQPQGTARPPILPIPGSAEERAEAGTKKLSVQEAQ